MTLRMPFLLEYRPDIVFKFGNLIIEALNLRY